VPARRFFGWFLKLAAGLALILWYGSNLEWEQVLSLLRLSTPVSLAAGASLIGLSIAVATGRWALLLKPLKVQVPFCRVACMTLVAVFYNVFTPGGIAGDAIRAVQSTHLGVAGNDATSSVITDRILGLLGLTVLALGGLAMNWATFVSVNLAGLFVILVPLIALSVPVLYSRRVSKFFARWLPIVGRARAMLVGLNASLKIYRQARMPVIVGLVLSVISNLLIVASAYALAVGIGVLVPFSYFLAFLPPILVLSTLPITVGGFGIREGAYLLLFPLVGASKLEALGTALLFTLTLVVVALCGGVLGFVLDAACARRTIPDRSVGH
jgi:uncharacterized protein (TIRG00374 family)